MPAALSHEERLARGIGAAARARRVELGFTQEAIAELAGMHRQGYVVFESGVRPPLVDTLIRVAVALGLGVGELVSRGESFAALDGGQASRTRNGHRRERRRSSCIVGAPLRLRSDATGAPLSGSR